MKGEGKGEEEEEKYVKNKTTILQEEKNIRKFRIPVTNKEEGIKKQNYMMKEEEEEEEEKKKIPKRRRRNKKQQQQQQKKKQKKEKKSLVESLTNNVKASIDMVYQACETDETISTQWISVVIETLSKGIKDMEDLKKRREIWEEENGEAIEEEEEEEEEERNENRLTPQTKGIAWSTRPIHTTTSGRKPKIEEEKEEEEEEKHFKFKPTEISINDLTKQDSPIYHIQDIDQEKLLNNLFKRTNTKKVKESPTAKKIRRINRKEMEEMIEDIPQRETEMDMPSYESSIHINVEQQRSKSAMNKRPSPLSPRHVKLSSPKKSIITYNMIEEKQAKAEANREYIRKKREERGKAKSERHRAVREKQALKEQALKEANEQKMKKARELANEHIEKIKEKAFVENSKIDEWRFVATLHREEKKEELEAKLAKSNKKRKVHLDKKTAKASGEQQRVAAAKAKRNQAQHERQDQLAAKRQQRERAVERRMENEKEEQRAIAEKNKKKAAKALAEKHREQVEKEERAMKLQQKMDNSSKRKDSTLSAIKQRAAASSERSFNQIKKTDVIMGTSALSEKPVNASKKHKKIRARLADAKRAYDVMMTKATKRVHPKQTDQVKRAFDKLKNNMDKSNVRKQITELLRILNGHEKEMDSLANHEDQLILLISIANKNKSKYPVTNVLKLLAKCCQVPSIATMLLCRLHLMALVPLFQKALDHSEIDVLTPLLAILIRCLHHASLESMVSSETQASLQTLEQSLKLDFVNYLVASTSLELLSRYISLNRSAIMNSSQLNNVLHLSFQLFHVVIKIACIKKHDLIGPLFDTLIIADMIPLLASFLLYNGRSTPKISSSHMYITLAGLRVLNAYALFDIKSLQRILAETTSFKHVMNFILRYCSQQKVPDDLHTPSSSNDDADMMHFPIYILNEAVVLLGYFALDHPKNQQSLQFAYQGTTLIQLLARLPIHYFTNASYKAILVPTLIAICDNHVINADILQQEMSTQFVFDFLHHYETMDKGSKEEPFALQNRLVNPKHTLTFFEKLE